MNYELFSIFATVDWKIIHIDETDSTNHWLRMTQGDGSFVTSDDITKEPSPCVIVVADYQTAGKGCGSNSWESERGKNLTFSMLIHPEEIPANEQFRITEMTSVAMCETLKRYGCKEVSIKWPNDIYVGDRKICGMLIENRLQGSVIKDSIIGIGLNVNQREFLSDAPNPVSLYQLTGQEFDLGELLKAFLDAFDSSYNSKTTCFAYKGMLYRRGRDSLFKDKTTCFTATLTDVLPDGRLLLVDQEGRERLYAFKEIQFII
ncbi:MAG: biotin--[acetyl-CoA-carboxylase] ligase [Prevotella sp.]|nr:biotin--[acetyl-CoA-carboxylase] ligase [Prevotella sp.]